MSDLEDIRWACWTAFFHMKVGEFNWICPMCGIDVGIENTSEHFKSLEEEEVRSHYLAYRMAVENGDISQAHKEYLDEHGHDEANNIPLREVGPDRAFLSVGTPELPGRQS